MQFGRGTGKIMKAVEEKDEEREEPTYDIEE